MRVGGTGGGISPPPPWRNAGTPPPRKIAPLCSMGPPWRPKADENSSPCRPPLAPRRGCPPPVPRKKSVHMYAEEPVYHHSVTDAPMPHYVDESLKLKRLAFSVTFSVFIYRRTFYKFERKKHSIKTFFSATSLSLNQFPVNEVHSQALSSTPQPGDQVRQLLDVLHLLLQIVALKEVTELRVTTGIRHLVEL